MAVPIVQNSKACLPPCVHSLPFNCGDDIYMTRGRLVCLDFSLTCLTVKSRQLLISRLSHTNSNRKYP